VPTFVAFMPWTTLEGYCDLLRTIDRLELTEHVSPVQLAIRLLVTEGSRLLELADVTSVTGPFNPASLTYPWIHPDPRVDRLQKAIESFVGEHAQSPRRLVFDHIWALAHEAAGLPLSGRVEPPRLPRASIPTLSEPWYCCAEPTSEQVARI